MFSCVKFTLTNMMESHCVSHANGYSNISAVQWHSEISAMVNVNALLK